MAPDAPDRRRQIFEAEGERWFAADRPIRRVHADISMFVGGIRALLLQSLHPLAMAGVAAHSDFRNDPWGRLARTSFFLAVTTFGPAADAERAVAHVRGVHRRVRGVAPDGRPYAASDPHLLRWVHIAEVDSFLSAYQRYGATGPLTQAERDAYVADAAVIAAKLGVIDPPRTEAEVAYELRRYRPELAGTPDARAATRYLLLRAPLPLMARFPYGVLASAAVGLMPAWTRWPLRLPYLPGAESTVGKLAGRSVVSTIRWATGSDEAVDRAIARGAGRTEPSGAARPVAPLGSPTGPAGTAGSRPAGTGPATGNPIISQPISNTAATITTATTIGSTVVPPAAAAPARANVPAPTTDPMTAAFASSAASAQTASGRAAPEPVEDLAS